MLSAIVHQVDGVKDLHRLMRVHSRYDLTDAVEIAIEEFAKPSAVIHRCMT